jgi:hypothetical protein
MSREKFCVEAVTLERVSVRLVEYWQRARKKAIPEGMAFLRSAPAKTKQAYCRTGTPTASIPVFLA